MNIPHKCNVLDPVKVSETRTNLVCVICGRVVGCWESDSSKPKIYPTAAEYSEDTAKSLV